MPEIFLQRLHDNLRPIVENRKLGIKQIKFTLLPQESGVRLEFIGSDSAVQQRAIAILRNPIMTAPGKPAPARTKFQFRELERAAIDGFTIRVRAPSEISTESSLERLVAAFEKRFKALGIELQVNPTQTAHPTEAQQTAEPQQLAPAQKPQQSGSQIHDEQLEKLGRRCKPGFLDELRKRQQQPK